MEKPNYYAVITAEVRYDKKLSSSEKLFYGEISALSSKTGECWASNSYFASLYNVSTSTISSWVKKLESKKYIHVQYEREGKQITKRIIRIRGQKNNHPIQNNIGGYSENIDRYSENLNTPSQKNGVAYSENLKENITRANNTREEYSEDNNINEYYGWSKDLIENKILDVLMNFDIHPEDKRYITALEYYKEAGMFEGISQKMEWSEPVKNNWWTRVLGRIEKQL